MEYKSVCRKANVVINSRHVECQTTLKAYKHSFVDKLDIEIKLYYLLMVIYNLQCIIVSYSPFANSELLLWKKQVHSRIKVDAHYK